MLIMIVYIVWDISYRGSTEGEDSASRRVVAQCRAMAEGGKLWDGYATKK